jgi:hypothetical protein
VAINIDFLPQEKITDSVLSGIQLANQQHAQQQANLIQQQNANTAQQEAQTATQRLSAELPEIQARTGLYKVQTANAQTESQIAAQKAVNARIASDYLNGVGGSATQQQLHDVIGDHHDPSVPIDAPQALNVANPIGQTLAQPTAPNQTTPTGPTSQSQPAGINADLAEVERRLNGFTAPEKSQIAYLLQVARENTNPHEGLVGFQTGLQQLIQKRSDPQYATEVALLKQGYSEPAAFALAKRNAEFSAELTKIEQQPEQLAGDKASVAKAQLQAAAQNPENTLENRQRATRLAQVAAVAEQNQLNAKAAQAKADQAAKDGDPRAAAQLLVSGAVSPSQLVSVRNPSFATKAFEAAQKLDPTWTATKAQADFKAAESPANLNFFGPAHSIIDKGGTLDQLEAAAKQIPGGKIPFFNKLADAQKAALGDGPIAKYAAIALGLADDYSKITGGGGSDSSREAALHLIPADASPAARAGSLQGIRGTVESQINSRIGNNRVLKAQYGIDSTPATTGPVSGGLSKAASGYLSSIGVAH